MDLFPENGQIGLDKTVNIVYNKDMIKKITKNEKENKMTLLNTHEIVAVKMQNGLTNESDQITEIGRVLVDMGKSLTERIWLLSHDEDFIPDVLSCYNHKPATEYGFFLAKR